MKFVFEKQTDKFLINLVNTEIVKLVSNFSSNKSPGPYNIPTKVLRNNIDSFKEPLIYLRYLSF